MQLIGVDSPMFKVAALADVHFNALPAEEMYTQLKETFLKYIDRHSLDMIVICGDLYDSIVTMNSKASYLSMEFMKMMMETSIKRGIKYVRVVKGTLSHDNNQLINLRVFEGFPGIDFKIIQTVTSETIEDMNILYIPEEYMKDIDEYYKDYTDKKYDMIFGHGMFKETAFTATKQESAVTLSGAPVFDSKKMCEMCYGPIVFGHIHTSVSIRKKIIYVGSFSRWVFGEEEKKGFLVFAYGKESHDFSTEFIENKLAEQYDTVTLVDCDKYNARPDVLVERFASLNKGKLRIKIIVSGEKDCSYVLNYLREYYAKSKTFKLVITDKRMVVREMESEDKMNEVMDKYKFVFDKHLPHAEKISKFIKIRYNKDIAPERIKEELDLL